MHDKLHQLSEKIDSYSLRERVLLLCCILVVLVGIWQLAFELPQERNRTQLEDELAKISTDQSAQTAQIAALTSAYAGDSQKELRAQRDALQLQLEALDRDLSELSHGLVSAEQLPQILQDVLVSTTRLKLIRVKTLPVAELPLQRSQEPAASDPEAAETEVSTGVYKHGVTLTVSGSYFELINFLQALEALEWRFYWDRLDYAVNDYPRAEIEIRVYTLSAEEGLLGV